MKGHLVDSARVVKHNRLQLSSVETPKFFKNHFLGHSQLIDHSYLCIFGLLLFAEICLNMDISSGSHILEEPLMFTPNFGSFSSKTGMQVIHYFKLSSIRRGTQT